MTHRIKEVRTLKNFVVSVIFQGGIEKTYDVKGLFTEYPQFQVFETMPELFEQVKVDVGGYGIFWNDELDLAADEIWNCGQSTAVIHEVDIMSKLGANLTSAREMLGVTQKELSERTGIYQADISKIERGIANPSVKTLQRLGEGLGMDIKIEFMHKNI